MPTLISKVFTFLWVTIWGRINVWQFLTLNKHYLILVGSNLILSLLFIYMAEQATVRTGQYRELKKEVAEATTREESLKKEIQTLVEQNATLVASFKLSTNEVNTNDILKDYDKWATDITALETNIQNASKLKGKTHDNPTPNK